MAIFNSYVTNYQRVTALGAPALCPAPPDVASAEPSGHRPYNSVGWRWSALTLSFRKEKQMDVGQNGRPRGPQMLV